jgi:acyl dehydratase
MTLSNPLDSLRSLTGQTLGPTDWRTMTEDSVNRLEELTRGEARLKVDPERARQHALAQQGGTIVPGFVTLAVGEGQLRHLLQALSPQLCLDLAAKRIRFITPVMIDQSIRVRATVGEVKDCGDGFEMSLELHIEVIGSDKPACVVEQVVRWYGA